LDETNHHIGKVVHKKLFDFKKLALSIMDKQTGSTIMISLLWAFALGMFIFAFQPFSLKVLGLNEKTIAMVFVVFGAIGFVSQMFLVGRATKMFGILKAFTGALLTLAIAFTLLFFVQNLTGLILACAVMAVSNSTVQTLIQTVLSNKTEGHRQGEMMGISASYMSIGQIFGPMAGGLMALLAIRYAFLAGAVIILIGFFISRKIKLQSEQSKLVNNVNLEAPQL
jgi:MFS family permease